LAVKRKAVCSQVSTHFFNILCLGAKEQLNRTYPGELAARMSREERSGEERGIFDIMKIIIFLVIKLCNYIGRVIK
jgi:hypothetical protein